MADPFVVLRSPTLQAAARRVVLAWAREYGEPSRGEFVDVLVALALGVDHRQGDPEAGVDPRARSALGQRLLELLRAEVIEGWSENDATHAEVLGILTAIERVREAIERGWVRDFAARLSGPDGLEILVDIAHDLRSPLTSILFLAETLERGQSGQEK